MAECLTSAAQPRAKRGLCQTKRDAIRPTQELMMPLAPPLIDKALTERGWKFNQDEDYTHPDREGELIRINITHGHMSWLHLNADFKPIAHSRYGRDFDTYITEHLT